MASQRSDGMERLENVTRVVHFTLSSKILPFVKLFPNFTRKPFDYIQYKFVYVLGVDEKKFTR